MTDHQYRAKYGWTVRKIRPLLQHLILPEDKTHLSYSGIKRLKSKLADEPEIKAPQEVLDFGIEFHKRLLEPHLPQDHQGDLEEILIGMIDAVGVHEFCVQLLGHSQAIAEQYFVRDTLHGYLDLLIGKIGVDFKTTRARTEKAFIKDVFAFDYFVQAWVYKYLAGLKHFYFVGVSKVPPHKIFVVDALGYEYRNEIIKAGHLIEFLIKATIDEYQDKELRV